MNNYRFGMIFWFVLGLVCDIAAFAFAFMGTIKERLVWAVDGKETVAMIMLPFCFMLIGGLHSLLTAIHSLFSSPDDDFFSSDFFPSFLEVFLSILWIISFGLSFFAPIYIVCRFPGWKGVVITIAADIILFIIVGFLDDD